MRSVYEILDDEVYGHSWWKVIHCASKRGAAPGELRSRVIDPIWTKVVTVLWNSGWWKWWLSKALLSLFWWTHRRVEAMPEWLEWHIWEILEDELWEQIFVAVIAWDLFMNILWADRRSEDFLWSDDSVRDKFINIDALIETLENYLFQNGQIKVRWLYWKTLKEKEKKKWLLELYIKARWKDMARLAILDCVNSYLVAQQMVESQESNLDKENVANCMILPMRWVAGERSMHRDVFERKKWTPLDYFRFRFIENYRLVNWVLIPSIEHANKHWNTIHMVDMSDATTRKLTKAQAEISDKALRVIREQWLGDLYVWSWCEDKELFLVSSEDLLQRYLDHFERLLNLRRVFDYWRFKGTAEIEKSWDKLSVPTKRDRKNKRKTKK